MEKNRTYSKIIAGTMTWGSWGKQLSSKEMIDLMHHCLSLGIYTFDHADIYGGYTNESDFGKAFAESGIARDEVQLVSKCGIQLMGDARKDTRVKHYNYDKDYIIWSAEQSLQKLKTDYLDLFLLHRPSPLMDPEIIAEAISQLVKEGKIKEVGVSNFTPSQIAMLETTTAVSANQIEFSLTANTAMYDGALDDCITKKRVAMSWSPLGSYFKENTPKIERVKKVIIPMAEKYNATVDQLLLAWILKHPSRIHPVVGTTSKERLTLTSKALEINLDLQDWFILLEASIGNEVP